MAIANGYFDVGTVDSPVCSNSGLSCINPEEGGSIIKFLNFFREKEEEKNSKSLEKGKLIHSYIEDPDAFVISDIEKPTDMMSDLLEELVVAKHNVTSSIGLGGVDINIDLTSKAKTTSKKEQEEQELNILFDKLASFFLKIPKEDAIRAFRYARTIRKSYTSYNEITVLKDIIEGQKPSQYFNFILSSQNKIVLNQKDGISIRGAISSLETHPQVSALLGLGGNTDIDSIVGEVFKEVPIYWSEDVISLDESLGKIKINCKALLDRLIVNHSAKTITYIDLKSSSGSIYTFQTSMERYRYYRQLAFYARALWFWFKNVHPDKEFTQYKLTMYLIPVETQGLFLTGVYDMSPAWINKGREEARQLLKRYAWHKAMGVGRYSYEEIVGKGVMKFKNPE